MSTITLDGTKSFSQLGATLTYLWSLDSLPSGSSSTLNSTTASVVTFVPDVDGQYTVKLIVNDGTTSSTATYSVNTLKLLSGTSNIVVTNNTSGIYIVSGNGNTIGTTSSITIPFGTTGTFTWGGYTSWGYSGSDGTVITTLPNPLYTYLAPSFTQFTGPYYTTDALASPITNYLNTTYTPIVFTYTGVSGSNLTWSRSDAYTSTTSFTQTPI